MGKETTRKLAYLTFGEANLTIPRKSDVVAEVGLLIYPDCQLSAIYGLTDLFRIASEWAVSVTGAKKPLAVRVSHWRFDAEENTVECVWDSMPGSDHQLSYVILPPSIIMPQNMQSMEPASVWLSQQHAQGATLCSVCAGAFLLAETGLMDGRRVTTHWAFAKALAKRFPKVEVAEEHMVLDDGDIMTAGGILAWTDLGLTLVDRLMGPSIMLATARFLLVEPPRKVQSPFSQFVPKFSHGDEAVLRAQHHLHAAAAAATGVEDLAALAGLGGRTFLRRFVKATGLRPTEYVQQVRVLKAREALELTNRSVEQIAWQVGYHDPTAFRKVFQKFTGLTPHLYRQRFGVAPDLRAA